MAHATHYTQHTLVAVHVPEKSEPMLHQYNGKCYYVRSWRQCGVSYMYTLEGCVSNLGVPYWFAHEWLRRVSE